MASLVRLSNQSNHGRQPVRSLVDFWCTNCQGNLSADPPSFLFFMSWGGVNPETRLVTNTKDRPFRITPLAVPTVRRLLQNPSKSKSEVNARLAEAHFKAHRRDDKSLKEGASQRHAFLHRQRFARKRELAGRRADLRPYCNSSSCADFAIEKNAGRTPSKPLCSPSFCFSQASARIFFTF